MNMLLPFLVLTALLWLMCQWHALRRFKLGRLAKRQEREMVNPTLPPISIIITCHDQLPFLQKNLTTLLEQDYPEEFEVIVVDMKSTDDTGKWLEYMMERYTHLHYSLCPPSARDISLQRLALTLGVRSAQHEWMLFMHPDVTVPNSHWLCHMSSACKGDVDAVQGFVRYSSQKNWKEKKQQFFRLWEQMLWMPFTKRHSPYRADGACLCYRRSVFMSHNGFASNATLLEGAETLLVNHNIKKSKCGINVSPNAIVTQAQPEAEQWKTEQIFFMETRRHKCHTVIYRLLYASSVLSQILFPLSAITAAFLLRSNAWGLCIVASLWLSLLIMQFCSFSYTTRKLGIKVYTFSFFLLLNLIPVWDLKAWMRWKFTEKRTFRKKFI